MKRLLPVLLLSAGLGGCGTILNFVPGKCTAANADIYGGIQFDGKFLISGDPLMMLCGLVDFPFSVVGDTLTLPWTSAKAVRMPARDPFERDREKLSRPKKPPE